jgi:phosphonate transport system substrate-binding protein
MDFRSFLLQSGRDRNLGQGSRVVHRSIRDLLAMALSCASVTLAHADWRQDLGTFHIGISASDANSVPPADLDKIEASYSKALGMPVEVSVLRDYAALIDAHVSGRIEYAIYSSTAYASAWLLCECVEPLAAPVLSNGATGTRSVLIVNASTPFTRLDLNGIRVGIPGKDSITGFAVPLASYTVGTRSLSQDEEFFKQFNNLESTAAAFAGGDLDAFFGWIPSNEAGPIAGAGIFGGGEEKALSIAGQTIEIKVPWKSALLRYGPHAVRRDLHAEAKSALASLLTSMDSEMVDLLGAIQMSDVQKLVAARQSEYALAVEVAKAAALTPRQ